MIQDVFCNIYTSIKNRNRFLGKIRFYSLLRWLTRRTANSILPVSFKIFPSKTKLVANHQPQIIVSLTTFPARIDRLWLVIECIFRQTVLPDKIIIWLSNEQFKSIDVLPKSLLKYINRGLDIRFVEEDIRSHKKYAYTIQEYPDAMIITIDDDIFYPSYTLQRLIDTHSVYPKDIIANVAHQISYSPQGELLPYNKWRHNILLNNCADNIFQVGVGGVLYPPMSLHEDVKDIQTAIRLCPTGDDIWLYVMGRLKGTSIRSSKATFFPLPIHIRYAATLCANNLSGGNDKQIEQTIDYCIRTYNKNPFANIKV